MKLTSVFRLMILACLLPAPVKGQEQDTMLILQILDQASLAQSVDLAREKYEAAYALSNQVDYDKGLLRSLNGLIPIELQENNSVNALGYLLEELELLEKYGQVSRLIQSNIRTGDLYRGESLHTEAIDYYQQAASLLSVSNQPINISLYDKIGSSYAFLFKPDSAQIYYSELLALPEIEEDFQLEILRKIVEGYQEARNYEAALDYNLQIQSLMEASPVWKDELGTIYNNLGYTYNFLAKYDKSIASFLKAEDFFQGDSERLSSLYLNTGIAYFNNREIQLAIQYLQKALSRTNQSDELGKAKINNILATIYLHIEDYFNAQNFNRNAVQSAIASKDIALRSEVYGTAAEIHSGLYEYEEAITTYKIHLNLRDSLLRSAQKEQEALFQENLRLEQTEKKTKLLLIKGEIQDLTIERQELEINNLNLAAQKKDNDLKLLKQSEEIRETRLKNQELETQRARQALQSAQDRLVLQEQESQLSELAQAEKLAKAEVEKKEALLVQEEQERQLLEQKNLIQQKTTAAAQRIGLLLFLISLLILIGLIYTRRTNKKLGQQKVELEAEQEKSENLLLNILPVQVAEELKEYGKTTPRKYDSVSILFSDFVDFTRISARISPDHLIAELNDCFMGFDAIMEEEGIEKIQTIGDGYLAVGGVPDEDPGHAIKCVRAARKMLAFLENRNLSNKIQWKARIGIHSGPITTGVVGTKKFAFNIFGDTVNTASRIETAGEQGRINVSADTYERIKDVFACEYRGKISAKGKGELDMYFVK
ncbi:MAG: adenylate/guanylate cyclase domain-containing protein [Bacteroidota bacterium]